MTKRRAVIAFAFVPVLVIGIVIAQASWRVSDGAENRGGRQQTAHLGGRETASTPLVEKLYTIQWVAYAPTNFNPVATPPVVPSDESIRSDLETLRQADFDGLVTYGAEIESIPRIAKEVGFRGILVGVWNPNSAKEMEKAIAAARSDIVVGSIIGNEGLMFRRYKLPALHRAMEEMKRKTGKPVSTTEVVEAYMTKKELVAWSDFLVPNAHPFFHSHKRPQPAVEWTKRAYQNITKLAQGKPVLLKEVGLPTAGERGLSEEAQAEYYALLNTELSSKIATTEVVT